MSPSTPVFFFFNDTATTEIYTLSLHDALPISCAGRVRVRRARRRCQHDGERYAGRDQPLARRVRALVDQIGPRSEEHTSELQSLAYLVCRLLLEKKKRRALP